MVSLLLEARFLAKNQLPSQAPEWITVPGIAHLNPDEPERNNSSYQAISKGYRKNPGVGLNGPSYIGIEAIKDIMRSHNVREWIVETVKEAYTRADRDQEDRVTAHEVRALSALWAYKCQVALPDIL